MLFMEYCARGEAISDFDADAWLERTKREIIDLGNIDCEDHIYLSTSLPFDLVRREIARGNLDCLDVLFVFNGHNIAVNKYGAVPEWPDGFCDRCVEVAQEILMAAMEQRKSEKSK